MASIINSTNSTAPNMAQSGKLSSDEVISFILGTCIAGTGFFINLTVILMILIQDKVKTVSDGLILHLTFCDLIAATITAIYALAVLANNVIGLPYKFSDGICKSLSFILPMFYVLTVATLTLISVERYRAIIHPMKPRISGKKVLIILLPVWLVTIAIAIGYMSETSADALNASYCILKDNKRRIMIFISLIYLILFGYIIPLIIMLYCYTKIIAKLKFIFSITASHVIQESYSQIQKKRVIKTSIAVSIIFMFTGIPFVIAIVINIYTASRTTNLTNLEINIGGVFSSIGIVLLLLAPMYNPVIYFVKKINNCSLSCNYKAQVIPNGIKDKTGTHNVRVIMIKNTNNALIT